MQKKRTFWKKDSECIGKRKDLRKAVKSLGLPNYSGECIVGAFAKKTNSKTWY